MKQKAIFKSIGILLTALFCFSLAAGCSSGSKAPKYPSKEIEFVVPFAAGGAVDVSTRIITAEVEKDLGQKIIVNNKGGGGATEGQGYVAKSKPDGYTVLAMTSSVIANTITKKVDYTIDSFEPLAMFTFDPEVLVVFGESPYKTIAEFIEASKKEPITVSTPGHSTSHHIAGVLLEQKVGAKFKYVHTKGAAESVPMVAGGHVVSGLAVWGEVKSLVQQGKLRVIGVMSVQRDPKMPDVPTFKESGIDIVYGAWRGFSVPKGTPPEIVAALEKSLKKAIESKAVQDKFAQSGYPISYKDSKAFAEYIKTDFTAQKNILDKLAAEQKK